MNKLSVFLSAILAVALVAGPSLATENVTTKTSDPAASTTYTENELLGMSVVNQNDEAIGKIKDVNVDTKSGKINFVIVEKGGILGLGGDEHALPLAALKIRSDEGKATLLVNEDKLAAAPEKAAGMSDEEFRGRIEEYYGVAPAWEKPTYESKGMIERREDSPAKSNY